MLGRKARASAQRVRHNPYHSPNGISLDEFRGQMKDILDLYCYMTTLHRWKRSKYKPFLTRNLSYMRSDIVYSAAIRAASVPLEPCPSEVSFDESHPTIFFPTVVFNKVKNPNLSEDYAVAAISCFHVRQLDDAFSSIKPIASTNFSMQLNEETEVTIDLPSFTADVPDGGDVRTDYLLLKVIFRPHSIAVSGGRRLRSVPARQAMQSEKRHSMDPESRPKSDEKVLLAAVRTTVARAGITGHVVKEGKFCLPLVPIEDVDVDVDDPAWLEFGGVVRMIGEKSRRVGAHPYINLEICVEDEEASVRSFSCEFPIPISNPAASGRHRSPSTLTSTTATTTEQSRESTAEPQANGNSAPTVPQPRAGGILGIVAADQRSEMLNAPAPEPIHWCFKMSDTDAPSHLGALTGTPEYLLALENAPPADIYRTTARECVICNTPSRNGFPSFVALLWHLTTCHPRLSFKYLSDVTALSAVEKTAAVKKLEVVEPKPGFVVTINRRYNGSHEHDLSRHFVKQRRNGIRRIPDAWSRDPVFIVVRNMARHIRTHPPTEPLDFYEAQNQLNDGTFGGDPAWKDPHFHTQTYAPCHQYFKQITHKRRIKEYVDVNENEKAMLTFLSDFVYSFRTMLTPSQAYGWHVLLVKERREELLRSSMYVQFITHLTNQLKIGNLSNAEFLDIVSRLKNGCNYDPRSDTKHFVHHELLSLEQQRATLLDPQRSPPKRIGRYRSPQIPADSCSDESSRDAYDVRLRKRSTDEVPAVVPPKKVANWAAAAASSEERQYNTSTPMDVLMRPGPLRPTEVAVSCLDDLVARYGFFAPVKQLAGVWHFCQEWSRRSLEWQ